MRARERLGCDCPDAAAVAAIPDQCVVCRKPALGVRPKASISVLAVRAGGFYDPPGMDCCFLDRVGIEVIARPLGQQEQILMRLGAAVGDAFRHGVRLVPNDVLPQIPAIRLQSEGNAPRDADEVFRLAVGRVGFQQSADARPRACGLLVTRVYMRAAVTIAALAASRIAIPEIQPQRSVIAQHAPHFAKHINQPRNERVRRVLQPDLPGHAVIAQAEVRRAGDAGMDRLRGQCPHPFDAVADNHAVIAHSEHPHGRQGG